ncbi:COMM domain-containing protein 6 [Ambystoma mexicanum]|uniref:COMM domain-containing protein 6 n=1 Tax=Ambystoma mexicanum TaxID=8296 RepID=UPI0037E7FC52
MAEQRVLMVRSLVLAYGFDSSFEKIKSVPPDLFAELCIHVIQHLQRHIPGVDVAELCQRFQTSGLEISVGELGKVVHAVHYLFSTAAKHSLSAEELSSILVEAKTALPKQILQVLHRVWTEQGESLSLSEDARKVAAGGQLLDFQWKLGMAVSSDTCRSLNYPYVAVALKVADCSGQVTTQCFEMTIPQFQNFFKQFKEMAAVLETV